MIYGEYVLAESGESESIDLEELLDLLKRISKRIGSLEYVNFTTIYIGWCIWLSTVMLVGLIINILGVSYWVFLAYLVVSFILAIIYVNVRLPKALRLLRELSTIEGMRVRRDVDKRVERVTGLVWAASFLFMPVLGILYGNLGVSTGLLLALGTGNLVIYLMLWRYYNIVLRGAIYLTLLLFIFAGLNVLLSMIKPGYEWTFTTISILFVYLLLAMYTLLLAFK